MFYWAYGWRDGRSQVQLKGAKKLLSANNVPKRDMWNAVLAPLTRPEVLIRWLNAPCPGQYVGQI